MSLVLTTGPSRENSRLSLIYLDLICDLEECGGDKMLSRVFMEFSKISSWVRPGKYTWLLWILFILQTNTKIHENQVLIYRFENLDHNLDSDPDRPKVNESIKEARDYSNQHQVVL